MTELAVIVPAYNRLELLRLVLGQLIKNLAGISSAIYVVDDGSTPPLSEQLPQDILSSINLLPQQNQGLVYAKYNGFKNIQASQYVLFLDSDDSFDKNKISAQMLALQESKADVCYTDVAKVRYNADDNSFSAPFDIAHCPHVSDPVELYLHVQPPPHSPIFSYDYLEKALRNPLIPLDPIYNPIGEMWFYYNLLLFPAKVVHIPKAWTWTTVHDNERLTNHWERLGVASLTLMQAFMIRTSCNVTATTARKRVSRAAFEAFRKLPRDFHPVFEKQLIDIWKCSRSASPRLGGNLFQLASNVLGPLLAAKLFRMWQRPRYSALSTVSKEELQLLIDTHQKVISKMK